MKPGVETTVLRLVVRVVAIGVIVAVQLLKDKLGTEVYTLIFGAASASLGNTFTTESFGQTDTVKLQQLHDSMQPPPPAPGDEMLQ